MAGATIFVISVLCTDKFYDASRGGVTDLAGATKYESYAEAQSNCQRAFEALGMVEIRQMIEY